MLLSWFRSRKNLEWRLYHWFLEVLALLKIYQISPLFIWLIIVKDINLIACFSCTGNLILIRCKITSKIFKIIWLILNIKLIVIKILPMSTKNEDSKEELQADLNENEVLLYDQNHVGAQNEVLEMNSR